MKHYRRLKPLLVGIFAFLSCALTFVYAAQVHNVIECSIISMEKKLIKKLPGGQCAFLPDGRVISGQTTQLSMYSPEGKLLWQKDIGTHHQVNLNLAKSKILTLSSEVNPENKKLVRYDVAMVLDFNGNVTARFRVFEHKQELEKWLPASRRGKTYESPQIVPGVSLEYSHANSIYEIPDNPLAKLNPAFAQGNYVLNVSSLRLFLILDKEMKKIIWHAPAAKFHSDLVHDLQVLTNGDLLFFSNNGPRKNDKLSTVYECQPLTGKVVWRWPLKPRPDIASLHSGGAQLLENGNILLSDNTREGVGIEVDRKAKMLWMMPNRLEKDEVPFHFQQIKRYDLTEFLKNNHSP